MKGTGLPLAWRLVRSDPRGGLLFFGSVLLGVWILVGVALTGGMLHARIEAETFAMLAADIRIEGSAPLDAWAEKHLFGPGRVVAKSLEFTAMARPVVEVKAATPQHSTVPPENSQLHEQNQLVEVKAVTPQHPLRGRVDLLGGGSLVTALQNGGAVVEANLLERLHLRVGEHIRIGDARFQIRAILAREPDRVMRLFSLGPRVFIDLDQVPSTHLIRPGSRVHHVHSLRLAPGETVASVAAHLETLAKPQGIHVLVPGKKQPGATRLLGRFAIFMGLVAVMALLVGGQAIAGSVANYMRERVKMVAVLKVLGADNAMLGQIFLWKVILLAGCGSLSGVLLGVATPWLLLNLSGDMLTGSAPYRPDPWLLSSGLALGILVSLLLALGPLWDIRRTLPGALFRSASDWGTEAEGRVRSIWPVFVVGLPLTATAVHVAGETRLALGFLGMSLVSLVGLHGLIRGCLRLLRYWHPRRPTWNLAVRALLRPENGALSTTTALSLGVSLVTAIVLLQGDLNRQIQTQLPKRIPALFFVDIQTDQTVAFQHLVRRMASEPDALRITPVVRGRLIDLRRASTLDQKEPITPANAWRFAREYVLTWSATLPPNNPLIAGQWWTSPTESGLSVEADMAHDLNLHLGDQLVFEIQGVTVAAPVRNIRKVTWSDMGLNFFVIFSPALLQDVPGTWLGSLAIEPDREEAVYQATVNSFPNVTVIRTREIMTTMRDILEKLAQAVTALGGLAVVAGLMVLWVAIFATRQRRAREGAVCRLLGATRGDVVRMALLEFFLQGVMTATLSLFVSQALRGAVAVYGFKDSEPWHVIVGPALLLWGAAVVMIVLSGWLALRRELSRPLLSNLFRV
ncbi:MAG: ABC transporter permease [Magnetococcales bacterium]|nr:ABC transporter permease [Magnetococcales bacterium]